MERFLSALTDIAITSIGRIHCHGYKPMAVNSAQDAVVFICYRLEILTTLATEGTPLRFSMKSK
jgi:hypothetical protein